MANVFENNEPVTDKEAIDELGERVHAMLPPLAEGYRYDLQKLASGRTAVVVEEAVKENSELERAFPDEEGSCGCGKYQGCSRCGKFQGDGLNSPESRTLRHD